MESSEIHELLANPDLVRQDAPWFLELDNLEIAILLLCLPWVGDGGQRRADVERRLKSLGEQLPVGAVYFQRVNRAVARLEDATALTAEGDGRRRRFSTSPAGLATLIVNLTVLRADPTLDGREFELKRAICAACHLVASRLVDNDGDLALDAELEAYFLRVESLEVFGRKVVTDDLAVEAFDVIRLVDLQRARVTRMLRDSEAVGERARAVASGEWTEITTARHSVPLVSRHPEGAMTVRRLLAVELPEAESLASAVRYRWYLGFLNELRDLYVRNLRLRPMTGLRQLAGARDIP